jgi:hypothetical protein
MLEKIDYQACSVGFAQTVASALSRVNNIWLTVRLRYPHLTNVAPDLKAQLQSTLDKHLSNANADDAVKQRLRLTLDSLVTHLQAINARFWTFQEAHNASARGGDSYTHLESNNSLVDLTALCHECVDSAAKEGARHVDLAAAALAELMVAELKVRARAEVLIQLIQDNAVKLKLPRQAFGPERTISVTTQTRDAVWLAIWSHKGDESCIGGLRDLFHTAEQRAELLRLAEQAFGHPVRLSFDFNSIEFEGLLSA